MTCTRASPTLPALASVARVLPSHRSALSGGCVRVQCVEELSRDVSARGQIPRAPQPQPTAVSSFVLHRAETQIGIAQKSMQPAKAIHKAHKNQCGGRETMSPHATMCVYRPSPCGHVLPLPTPRSAIATGRHHRSNVALGVNGRAQMSLKTPRWLHHTSAPFRPSLRGLEHPHGGTV